MQAAAAPDKPAPRGRPPRVWYIPGMSIDTYAACPGGTGKKIKFCCADLVGDLEQLDTLIGGDQTSAALDQVRRLLEKHPGRACLLATQTKLELATKQFGAASATAQRFLETCPDNPLALGQSAITEAVAGRMQEAAALFDRARAAAFPAEGGERALPTQEFVRIAETLVQAAAQTGHVGFAQGVVEWLAETSLAPDDELRMLGAIVGSAGVSPALRTQPRLLPLEGDSPWRFEFDTALKHAEAWRLGRALTTFRSLKGVAGDCRPLFTNIALLCERLARPMEASEAWLVVAGLPDVADDDAIEATGRAIALETEANPDRSPQVRFASVAAPLGVAAGEEGVRALELLEDALRHDPRFSPAAIDRAQWTSRNAVPPRSVWRVYEDAVADGPPPRLLASLLVFGRQTDREPEAVLQGFAPDVATARPACEDRLGCRFADGGELDGVPGMTPTAWLLNAQFQIVPPSAPPAPPAPGEPSIVDVAIERQRAALWSRFAGMWPDTALPELIGRTPREALGTPDGRRRVEALVREGEATARQDDASAAWSAIRERLGLTPPGPIACADPLDELPPLRWHRVPLDGVGIDQLRGLLVTAADAGFDRAAALVAEALAARPDATPEDRWGALGLLEERAATTVRRLEIIAELRTIAADLRANDGMLDVAELRVRLQRGDQAEFVRLVEHMRRDHARDPQVLQGFAEVLAEAGIDVSALAAAGGMAPGGVPRGAVPGATAAAPTEPGKLWTPAGGEPPAAGTGEKKVIWTPS